MSCLSSQVLQLYLDGQPVPEPPDSGCSCEAVAAREPALGGLLLLAVLLRRRRA